MIDLSTKKLIIFDADGTLRRCTVPGQPCPNKADEWELMPGAKERLATLPKAEDAIRVRPRSTFAIPPGARLCGVEVPEGLTTAEEIAAFINAHPDIRATAKVISPGQVEVDVEKRGTAVLTLAGGGAS